MHTFEINARRSYRHGIGGGGQRDLGSGREKRESESSEWWHHRFTRYHHHRSPCICACRAAARALTSVVKRGETRGFSSLHENGLQTQQKTTGNGIAARRTNADSSPRKSRHVRAILERAGTAARRCARFCARRMRCRSARLRGPPRRSSRIVLARAARTLDPIDDGRPVRRGRLIRRVGPNVRAPGTRARRRRRSRRARARPRPSPVRVRRGGGGGRARAPRRNVRGPGLRVTSRPPRSRRFPPASSTRDAPSCDASRDPQAVPRAPAHRVRANDRIRRRRRRRPRAAARHSRPSPDPRSRRGGARRNPRADLKKETRAANRQLARAEAARAAAAAEAAKASEERRIALEAEQAARRAELDSRRRARRTLINDTTASAATGVFIVSRSARCGDPRADPFSSPPRFETSLRDAQRQRRCTRCDGTTPWRNPRARTAFRQPSRSRSFEARCATSSRPSPTPTGYGADTRTCRT